MSVILPVKGIRQHSISNWLAQMASKYKGGLEYVFVVESAQDQAIPGLRSVINQLPQVGLCDLMPVHSLQRHQVSQPIVQ